jgi:mRNA interferase MazF
VVLQADHLPLSTLLVAPTSTSAREATFRPEIELEGTSTRVLVEQTTAVDPQRLGDFAGRLSHQEVRAVEMALRDVLDLM